VRTYRYISADSHIHNNPDRWAQRVPAEYRERLPRRVGLPGGREGMMDEEGHVSSGGTGHFCTLGPEGFDPTIMHYESEAGYGPPDQRLREMDADGLDAEILFSFTGSVFGPGVRKDKGYAVHVYHAYNAYIGEEFCSFAPDRLLGIGLLPNKGVDEDIAEMEHCAKLGLRGVMLQTYPSGESHPSDEDDRFWAAAIDMGMPLTIHTQMSHRGGNARGDFHLKYPKEPEGYDRPVVDLVHLMSRYMHHHCGGLEITQMVVSGLFERFPNLKIYWAENNIGWVPQFLEQMDMVYEANHLWAERILGVQRLARRPSEYVRDQAYFGFFDDPFGIRARHDVGVDHALWGSDFPHEVSRWPHSREYLEQQFATVPEDETRKMLCENAVKFFNLDK
jgi:uncharacterized protein